MGVLTYAERLNILLGKHPYAILIKLQMLHLVSH